MTDHFVPTHISPFNAPWSLRFERDGTEDVAVIRDADGEELARSRPFRPPEGDDPVPPPLAAMRLIASAPALLEAGRLVVSRWERGDLAEAARACQAGVDSATDAGPPRDVTDSTGPDIDAILARRHQIAVVWGVEDVQEVRPDLDDDRAWEVLEAAKRHHDASIGINWDVLVCHAELLFGDAPDADGTGEG